MWYRIWHHPSIFIHGSDLLHLDLTLLHADWTQSRINSLTLSRLQCLLYSIEDGPVRLGYSRNLHIFAFCVCFKGWLRVYYGPDLSLSKLSVAQSSWKFCERHTRSYCVRPELGVGKLEGSEHVAGSWYRQGGNIHGAGVQAEWPYSFCSVPDIDKYIWPNIICKNV